MEGGNFTGEDWSLADGGSLNEGWGIFVALHYEPSWGGRREGILEEHKFSSVANACCNVLDSYGWIGRGGYPPTGGGGVISPILPTQEHFSSATTYIYQTLPLFIEIRNVLAEKKSNKPFHWTGGRQYNHILKRKKTFANILSDF